MWASCMKVLLHQLLMTMSEAEVACELSEEVGHLRDNRGGSGAGGQGAPCHGGLA